MQVVSTVLQKHVHHLKNLNSIHMLLDDIIPIATN
jgi:hypothetical protein